MRTAFDGSARRGRAGFTLIELLVVVVIIVALAGLTLGAVFNLREAQMKSFTETTVQKLASMIDQQWKAALDQIRDETTPQWAMTLANNDTRRARVIYTKARLKQEFPVTFYQAKFPYLAGDPGMPVLAFGTIGLSSTTLPAKATYLTALQTYNPTGNSIPLPAAYESSALLFLALSQGRRGMAVNIEEHIEPTAIQTRDGFKVFVDSWGNPVRYYIFPFDNDELNDPSLPYVPTYTRNASLTGRDPQDPEGTLMMAGWRYQTAGVLSGNANAFGRLLHRLPSATDTNPLVKASPDTDRHLIPVVASAGRDGVFGDELVTSGPTAGQPTANALIYMRLNQSGSTDNIYSYRLRQSGARGD
jgi:prepilin-type N-terminal cleavage/methylation domain-containing protein